MKRSPGSRTGLLVQNAWKLEISTFDVRMLYSAGPSPSISDRAIMPLMAFKREAELWGDIWYFGR